MSDVFEPAPTGRARCRGCGQAIAKDSLRFGERVPNAFGEGEATLLFHPRCAAFKRPEPLLAALPGAPGDLADAQDLERVAKTSVEHRRLARIDGAERAPGSQAKCRQCHDKITKGGWRIRLTFFEEGRFSPGGFVHLACRRDYFERDDVAEAVLHFSPALEGEERAELERALSARSAPAET
jgi:hypothetical protein